MQSRADGQAEHAWNLERQSRVDGWDEHMSSQNQPGRAEQVDTRLDYSRGMELELELEKNWGRLKESRLFLIQHTGGWQVLTSGESRRLERQEKRMRSEILQRKKKKYGKAGSKKLTFMEEVIVKNQTKRLLELAEVKQNIGREETRRNHQKLERTTLLLLLLSNNISQYSRRLEEETTKP